MVTPICTEVLHSRHKPRSLKALRTRRQVPQCHDRQEVGRVCQGRESHRLPLHPGVRADAEQGKWLWKTQPSKRLLLLPLCEKQGKVQKNKPMLISIQKLQVENEGKLLFSL